MSSAISGESRVVEPLDDGTELRRLKGKQGRVMAECKECGCALPKEPIGEGSNGCNVHQCPDCGELFAVDEYVPGRFQRRDI